MDLFLFWTESGAAKRERGAGRPGVSAGKVQPEYTMISHTAEYALRAMVCLSVDWKAPKTTHEIADQTKIPQGYLPKVMQQLGRAGLVQAQRGIYGGYSLKRHPSLVSLWEIPKE